MFKKKLLLITACLTLLILSACGGIKIRQITTVEYESQTTSGELNQLYEDRLGNSSTAAEAPNDLADNERELIIRFMHDANQVEIIAGKQLNVNLARGLHSGGSLEYIENTIAENRKMLIEKGQTRVFDFDPSNSYYLDIDFISPTSISVQACEYWRTTVYKDNTIEWDTGWLLVPMLFTLELKDGSMQAVDFIEYQGSEFCHGPLESTINLPVTKSQPTAVPIPPRPTPSGPTGQITWQKWNISWPEEISDLTSRPNYPNFPNESDFLNQMDSPINTGDTFGQRMIGYLYPPETGVYTFWVSGDNATELWLSSDSDPENATLIAYSLSFTNYHEWERYSSQQSIQITLHADQAYYIEALSIESGADDHLSVAWQAPNLPRQIIEGKYLEPLP